MAVLADPWWQVVLGYLAMTAAASVAFVFFLIGTHFSDLAEFPGGGRGRGTGRTLGPAQHGDGVRLVAGRAGGPTS